MKRPLVFNLVWFPSTNILLVFDRYFDNYYKVIKQKNRKMNLRKPQKLVFLLQIC